MPTDSLNRLSVMPSSARSSSVIFWCDVATGAQMRVSTLERVHILFFDPKPQGFKASFNQITGHGIQTASKIGRRRFNFGDQLLRGQGGTTANITVAPDIFGSAVGNNVKAEIQRILVDRCRKGIVDDSQDIFWPGKLGHRFNVRNYYLLGRNSMVYGSNPWGWPFENFINTPLTFAVHYTYINTKYHL